MLTSRINTANDHSASLANEVMSAMRTDRSMEEKERSRYKKDLNKIFLSGVAKSIMIGFTVGALNMTLWGTIALAVWYGGGLVINRANQ